MARRPKSVPANFPVSTLTVGELIARLKNFDEDTPVVLVSDYGDHCHTPQALGVEDIEESMIQESGYSASGYRLASDDRGWDGEGEDDEDGEPMDLTVVALRT